MCRDTIFSAFSSSLGVWHGIARDLHISCTEKPGPRTLRLSAAP